MPTSFERQCLGALKLAGTVLGESPFTLTKIPGTFHGVFNELTQERSLDDGEQGGGRKTVYGAVLICARDQFRRTKPGLGMVATLEYHKFRVVKVDEDAISFTLYLGNFNR